MEKRLLQEIKHIISDAYDIDYTAFVKSTLYTIGYIKYLNKFIYITSFSEFIEYYIINHNVSIVPDISLFNEFKIFKFNSPEIEKKVIRILYNYRNGINIENIDISNMYENLLSHNDKKQLGKVYTPIKLIDYIVDLVFDESKISIDYKVIDPACGSGYFLQRVLQKLQYIIEKNNIIQGSSEEITRYIIENMIYGVDIDNFSVFLTRLSFVFQTGIINLKFNIFNYDFLHSEFIREKFDIILGNPPYVGHKKTNKEYSKLLKQKYSEVYYEKADLSYCFFQASRPYIKDDGLVCFLTSRYFLEAKYADRLRSYLQTNYAIKSIFDFSGKNVFSNATVSPLLIYLCQKKQEHTCDHYNIHLKKYNYKNDDFDDFFCDASRLDNKNGWAFLNNRQQLIYDKITAVCNCRLGDICEFKQGIITGYDSAFVVNDEIIEKYKIEKELLRRWIKNSSIRKDKIIFNNLYIIYSNLIDDEAKYPNTLSYLAMFRYRLEKRRECINGSRKWYQLQWGRDIALFQNEKIVFPYKAKESLFFLDRNMYFCSADIYMMYPKREYYKEYLEKYLNSSVFEYMYKLVAKKVGENLYEFYPNKLENIRIYVPEESIIKKILDFDKKSLEKYLYKLFNISMDEQIIINN